MTKKETLKWTLQILASIISAVLTALGISTRKPPTLLVEAMLTSVTWLHPIGNQEPYRQSSPAYCRVCDSKK